MKSKQGVAKSAQKHLKCNRTMYLITMLSVICRPSMTSEQDYPGHCAIGHPDVFNMAAMPEQPSLLKPGQLPIPEIEKFFKQVCKFSYLSH